MDLPVELWMRIFEEVSPNDYARPLCVEQYRRNADSISEKGDPTEVHRHDKRAAMKTLPPFERQAWHSTRAFYAINHNSRAAALRLRLSRRLILKSKVPIQLQYHPVQRDVLSLARQHIQMIKHGSPFVIELFHFRGSKRCSEWKKMYDEFTGLIRWLTVGPYGPLGRPQLLGITDVVVLAKAPHQSECCADWWSLHLLSIVKSEVEKFWQDNNLKDRRISVYL